MLKLKGTNESPILLCVKFYFVTQENPCLPWVVVGFQDRELDYPIKLILSLLCTHRPNRVGDGSSAYEGRRPQLNRYAPVRSQRN